MKCECCNEDFIHSDRQEDLCPECEDLMLEGTTQIALLPEESAIVFRCNGKIELYMGTADQDRTATDGEMLAVALLLKLQDAGFQAKLQKELDGKINELLP